MVGRGVVVVLLVVLVLVVVREVGSRRRLAMRNGRRFTVGDVEGAAVVVVDPVE